MQIDLPELVRAGIISSDTATQIAAYYQSKKSHSTGRFNTVLGILGALLVSAGIVLVIAHNWDELGKTIKTVFAFLPIVIGQGLCAYALLRKKDSVLWREGCSLVLFFAMAAGISLISQVYQVSGRLDQFILTWLLVTAPLVYIMKSSATSLLVIALATWHGYLVGYDSSGAGFQSIPWQYVGFLLFVAPHYFWYARNKRQSLFFHFHSWFLALSLIINLGTVNSIFILDWGAAVYLALFGLFYAMGNTVFFKRMHILSNPFLITGLLGTLGILFFWTFEPAWSNFRPTAWKHIGWLDFPFNYVLFAFLLTTAVLMIYNYRRDNSTVMDPTGFSAFFITILLFIQHQLTATIFTNCWVLIIGLYYIRKGSLQNHFGILNLGLLIVLLLAIFRFFDENIPFVWRGFFFVLAGTGFFLANYMMVRKRKAVTQNNNS